MDGKTEIVENVAMRATFCVSVSLATVSIVYPM